jgi:methylenetetrahydrofolate dehydrogenase (NADP+)/methenyltetrahydrofolate cyclohydrolase
LIDVDVYKIKQDESKATLNKLNNEDSVHAIIVQLPLEDPSKTGEIVNLVNPNKDVDGLGKDSIFEPATPMAILWLLSGYNIDLMGKYVLLVGQGRLVGAPLKKIMDESGVNPAVVDKTVVDLKAETLKADVLITATGVAGLIMPNMLKEKAVVVDAGVASEGGKTVGDVSAEVYETRDDITISPIKGGVGPLTVCALFENVIRAAKNVAEKQKQVA